MITTTECNNTPPQYACLCLIKDKKTGIVFRSVKDMEGSHNNATLTVSVTHPCYEQCMVWLHRLLPCDGNLETTLSLLTLGTSVERVSLYIEWNIWLKNSNNLNIDSSWQGKALDLTSFRPVPKCSLTSHWYVTCVIHACHMVGSCMSHCGVMHVTQVTLALMLSHTALRNSIHGGNCRTPFRKVGLSSKLFNSPLPLKKLRLISCGFKSLVNLRKSVSTNLTILTRLCQIKNKEFTKIFVHFILMPYIFLVKHLISCCYLYWNN